MILNRKEKLKTLRERELIFNKQLEEFHKTPIEDMTEQDYAKYMNLKHELYKMNREIFEIIQDELNND